MGRRYTVMAAVIAIWGLVACDSSIVDSLLADDGVGPTDVGVDALVDADVEVRMDADPDATVGPDDGVDPDGSPPPLDAAPGDGPVVSDATPDTLGDAMGDGPPPDAIPDMTQPDAMPDVAPPDPDAAPDSGIVCLDDAQCEGICDDGRCAPCASGDECPGGRCEAGVCLDCRDGADCGGAICEGGACRPCIDRAECGGGQACIGGVCGACVGTPDCAGDVCVDGACQRCDPANHDGCGADELCCLVDPDGGPACAATDPLDQCAECGVACDGLADNVCADRTCECGGGPACGGEARFCVGEAPGGACLQCRDEMDCPLEHLCAPDGSCVPVTVVDAMAADGDLGALLAYLEPVSEAVDLRGRANVTVFAPDNGAFGAISPLCAVAIDRMLERFIRHHIVLGNERISQDRLAAAVAVSPDGLPLDMESLESVLTAGADGQGILVDGRPLLRSIDAGNGVVHVLGDAVLSTADLAEAGCLP